jgi:hypothetical protein
VWVIPAFLHPRIPIGFLELWACLRGLAPQFETTEESENSGMLEWLFYGIFLYPRIPVSSLNCGAYAG